MEEDQLPKPPTPAPSEVSEKLERHRPSNVSEFNLEGEMLRQFESPSVFNVDDDVTSIARELRSSVAHLEYAKISTKNQWISGIIGQLSHKREQLFNPILTSGTESAKHLYGTTSTFNLIPKHAAFNKSIRQKLAFVFGGDIFLLLKIFEALLLLKLLRTIVGGATSNTTNTTIFTFGMQAGWLSPNLSVLQNSNGPIGRAATNLEISWIAGIFSLLAMCTSTVYGVFSDKFGRKLSLYAIVFPQLLNWVFKYTTRNITTLLISQAFGGISAGGIFAVCPVYTIEISRNEIRGAMLSIAILLQGFGTLLMFLMGQNIEFYTCSFILTLIPIVNSLCLYWIPDSPPYLVSKGNFEKAVKTIALLNGLKIDHPHINLEIMRLMHEQMARQSTTELVSYKKLLKTKSVQRALLIAITIEFLVELGGCFVIVNYASWIIGEDDTKRANLLSLATPLALIVGTAVSFFTVERAGRRILLLISIIASILSTLLLAIPTQLKSYGYHVSPFIAVAGIIFMTFFYGGGIYAVGYIVMPEVLSYQLRSKVMSMVLTMGWLLCFLQVLFFPVVCETIGMFTVFYFFCLVNIVGGIILFIYLPETKDKTQAEIDKLLLTKWSKRERSGQMLRSVSSPTVRTKIRASRGAKSLIK